MRYNSKLSFVGVRFAVPVACGRSFFGTKTSSTRRGGAATKQILRYAQDDVILSEQSEARICFSSRAAKKSGVSNTENRVLNNA